MGKPWIMRVDGIKNCFPESFVRSSLSELKCSLGRIFLKQCSNIVVDYT